ncbi:MAG: amidohydrolase family protein [Thermodesulfobacteriota bacterium]
MTSVPPSPPHSFDLLIVNAILLPDPAHPALAPDSFLAITAGSIAALGPMASLPPPHQARRIIDAAGGLVMPGLINCHCHAAMTLFRGLADDLPLMTWLTEHIFPAEAAWVKPEMVYWCSRLAAAELLLSGTTCVADGYFHEDAAAQAFVDAGIRAVAAQGIIDFPAPGVADPANNIATAASFLTRWRDASPLLTPALFCHSPYTCGPETLRRAKALARERDDLLFIHLAETRQEAAQIHAQHGVSPTGLLHRLGLLDNQTVCVHGVWLDEADTALLRQSGARLVTCPESNMKLASGTAPLPALRAAAIPVGLGTDGCASNNDLDLFQEMGACARLHKLAGRDPAILPASALLAMATVEGARVLALEGKVGRLAAGMRADCIIVETAQPRLTPFYGSDTLVYAGRGSDVRTVVVEGRVVVDDRRLIGCDLQEIMTRVREMAARVAAARR